MDVTEVKIKLMDEPGERLKAFCSVTLDNCFVVRDLKIIEGASGPFVAMPSRKLTAHCPRCGMKNHLRAQHCNQCGASLPSDRMPLDHEGRAKLYADIAHPINSSCREMIQDHVIREYEAELQRAEQPDYVSRYDDYDVEYDDPKPAPTQPRSTETRVDQRHDQRGTHTPNGGEPQKQSSDRNQGPVPPPKSAAQSPPRTNSESFGAGILPDS